MSVAPTTSSSTIVSEHASQPRQSRGVNLRSLWALYTFTLRQHRHGKRWMVMAVLMLLPAGLSILARATAQSVPSAKLEFLFAFMLIPQALLPLVSLIYASGIIQDEQEDQTLTYLLIRPLPKWAIYAVKLVATLTITVALTVVFTALTYAAVYLGAPGAVDGSAVHRCVIACAIHALAVATYCCLFGLLGLLTRRILIAGILYIAIVEGLFANLAFGIRLITVIYYARLIAYRSLAFMVPIPNGTQDFAADAWQLDLVNDPQLATHPQLSTCLLVLLLTSAAAMALGAFICSRREFHVKTPEKA
jgi:ABC-2 type transport system permease protein